MSGHLPGVLRSPGHPTALPPEESRDGECVDDRDDRGETFVARGRTVLPRDRTTTVHRRATADGGQCSPPVILAVVAAEWTVVEL